MAEVTMKDLLEAGAHFGHKTSRWNPKMRPFIFTERAGVHIFDLEITIKKFFEAMKALEDASAADKVILFVATKKQAQEIVKKYAGVCGMPYVVNRWMGGTLTNYKTLFERITKLKKLEQDKADGVFEKLTKKERMMIDREIDSLNYSFEGLKELEKVPDVLFVIDTVKEQLAIREAKKLGLNIIAVCDSNSDPESADYCIPANDDAVRAIELYAKEASDAVIRGKVQAAKRAEEPMKEKTVVSVESVNESVKTDGATTKEEPKSKKEPKAKKEAKPKKAAAKKPKKVVKKKSK